MAIDLYIREVDSLRFELSTDRCSDRFSRLADEILEKGMFLSFSIKSPIHIYIGKFLKVDVSPQNFMKKILKEANQIL